MQTPWLCCGIAPLVLLTGIASPTAPDTPIHCGIEMRNVALHVAEGVVLDVRSLDREFVSRKTGEPPVFDDPESYTLRIRAADLAMDSTSLTNLLQQALKAHPSPLRDVRVTIENGDLHARGTLQKGVPVPFSMTATVSAAADGACVCTRNS
jgi:hypothetical protein